MKFGPVLLLNVLCVAVGLFLYDTLREDRVRPSAEQALDDPLQADAVGAGDSAGEEAQRLARRNADRLDRMEADLQSLRAANPAAASPTPAAPRASGGGLDVAGPADGRLDEGTLTALTGYLDEINRRKGAERQRQRMELEFRRRGLDLTAEEQEVVIAATLEFQRKAASLKAPGVGSDEAARARQLEAYRAIQADYVAEIRRSLSEEKAEKILKSRLGRGIVQPGGRGLKDFDKEEDD